MSDDSATMTMGAAGGAATALPAAESTATRSLPLVDMLTIGAIAIVVVLVTIPRLRAFAVRANELDAMHMLRALSAQPAPNGRANAGFDLSAIVAQDAALKRRLEDLECLEDGRVRRHGYLFDMTLLRPGEPMLRAWPWNQGQTGCSAFVWTPQRGLLGVPNTDGRYSGPDHPPRAAAIGADWLRMVP
jgi:hypothetical protein